MWKDDLAKLKEFLPEYNIKEDKIITDLKFIDTHAHYNSVKFNKNRDKILTELRNKCENIINLGTDMKSNTDTLILISLYDYLYGCIGFFPTDVWQLEKKFCPGDIDTYIFNADDNLTVFKKQLLNQKVVGIGEIGLDYHWNCIGNAKNKPFCTGEEAREIQKKWFMYQLDLAKEKKLPVSMHSRDAEEDTIKVFKNYSEINGVMHCFSYGLKSAEFYLNKGLYLGIGGTCTYPSNKELRQVIKECPLDRILLETDAPYLSPIPFRSKLNTSANIIYVIEEIAKIKGISEENVIKQTNINAKSLFKI